MSITKSTDRTPKLDKLNPIQLISLDKLNPIQLISLDKLDPIQLTSLDKLNPIQLIRILLSKSLRQTYYGIIMPWGKMSVFLMSQIYPDFLP
uniref:Uncharacterized protein n=1 Tax=Globodera rostochiensis TaxID=31243 RepID=A0A914HRI6_GLORO